MIPFTSKQFEPLSEAERSVNYEANQVQINRGRGDDADAGETRSAILHLMGTWSEGIIGKTELIALLARHEANLRKAWEQAELGYARQRADDAMRGACRAIMEGKLL